MLLLSFYINIHIEEKTRWSCNQETAVEEVKQRPKSPVGQNAQRQENRTVEKKPFVLTNQSSKAFGRIEGSIRGEELVNELQSLYQP